MDMTMRWSLYPFTFPFQCAPVNQETVGKNVISPPKAVMFFAIAESRSLSLMRSLATGDAMVPAESSLYTENGH